MSETLESARSKAETHKIMGGKVNIYRRENSDNWQRSTFLNGRNWRVSTHEDSLSRAKDFAEDWYLALRGKAHAVLLPKETRRQGKKFQGSRREIPRGGSHSYPGPARPDLAQSVRTEAERRHPSLSGRKAPFRNHVRRHAGIPHLACAELQDRRHSGA
jgi:hypothetical protein